eukprot:TRINITY_DN21178_c0_g1_i1.p1 TRINITY_DN21178_c0_g1~~TRINITY_DN21178_c0_g1_i1.p1  ORF type:complete len:450 (+),score=107.79 TRINITY_DN21178_c0_g1_i1:64-1350(+)
MFLQLGVALLVVAQAPLPNDTRCNFHGGKQDWIHNETLLTTRGVGQRTPKTPPHVVLNLDLPPSERWNVALQMLPPNAKEIINQYLDSLVPKWAIELIETVVGPLIDYKGWGEEYSQEMEAIAKQLDLPKGQVVALNLMYVLENIGINCSNWNDTGPTGECVNNTKMIYPFKTKLGAGVDGPPGVCTSIVAERPDGTVVHGRNFDWNIPDVLRPFIWEVEFQRGGVTLWTGTSIATYIGVQNAMKPGENGFAITMDARCQGGLVWENAAEMMLKNGLTPSLLARSAMMNATSFENLVGILSYYPLIAPMYFIVSGGGMGQGAIITRDREKAIDVWRIDSTQTNGWWRLETNYDHWEPTPEGDDRRGPGNQHVQAVGRAGMNESSMFGIMTQWPTFNPHTDHTAVFIVKDGVYNTTVWFGDGNATRAFH